MNKNIGNVIYEISHLIDDETSISMSNYSTIKRFYNDIIDCNTSTSEEEEVRMKIIDVFYKKTDDGFSPIWLFGGRKFKNLQWRWVEHFKMIRKLTKEIIEEDYWKSREN